MTGLVRPDHLVIAAATLDEGAAHVAEVLGTAPQPGGRHAAMGTENRLLGLGPDLYLEVIAIDPEAPTPDHPRWFDLDNFDGAPRLTNWVARCENLNAALQAAPPAAGRPLDFFRGDLAWRMAVPGDGRLPFDGCFPGLLEWRGDMASSRLPDSGCRLRRLTVIHPQAAGLQAALDPLLQDPLVAVSDGPAPALRAEIDTPHGLRVLG